MGNVVGAELGGNPGRQICFLPGRLALAIDHA